VPDRLVLTAPTSSPTPSLLPSAARAALADLHWRAAMEEEYGVLINNGTWELVPRPQGSNVVTGKCVFTHKLRADGTLDRYKARWVLRGFTQRPGVDYDVTFSLVVKPVTVHTVLATAVSCDWPIQQLDVKNVFLHGTLRQSSAASPCLTGFTNPAQLDLVYLLLYVDDIILTASNTELLHRTISALQREFIMKDLDPLHHFLGITVECRPDGLFLH
jgi:hypothetical protein